MSVRHNRQAGFTLLEVMMALTVLAIGMLGVVALQASTIGATQDGTSFAIANSVARTWVQRLQRDAQRWNHPSVIKTSTDIGDTVWLKNVGAYSKPTWFRPDPGTTLESKVSPAFDRMGNDVMLDDKPSMINDAIYCAHVRLRQLYPDMMKAEVRVFWKKRRMGDYVKYATYGMADGICSISDTDAISKIGADDTNFHWTYSVTGISKARAE